MADVPDDAEVEKIFTISIGATRGGLKNERARHAIELIKTHVSRHMKAKRQKVWIDPHVNELVWTRGGERPPVRVKVKAMKFEDGLVEVSLPKA